MIPAEPTPLVYAGQGGDPSQDVSSPSHYRQGKIEVIEAIELLELGTHESHVVEYVSRWDKKGSPVKDLEKAIYYCRRLLVNYKVTQKMPLTSEEFDLWNTKGRQRPPGDDAPLSCEKESP